MIYCFHTKRGVYNAGAGTKALNFTLGDKDGTPVFLSDFRGKKVVLYFYPKDNTPGCTRQARAFAGAYEGFKAVNTVVIGISKDSAASHRKFAKDMPCPSSFSPTRIGRRCTTFVWSVYLDKEYILLFFDKGAPLCASSSPRQKK